MFQKPDYATARRDAGFQWDASCSQGALREATGIPIREFNLDPKACIEAYRRGRPRLRELFGEEVGLLAFATPAISYGHVNGLGSELLFPEGGEVGQTHICRSLEEGITTLKKPVNYAAAGMAPFYLEFRRKMQDAFPGEKIGFSYRFQGPLTTAYELRGDGVFADIYDNPPLFREFLRLTTDSILDFHRFLCEVRGDPPVNPVSGGLCDDIAAMIPPSLWEEMVLPYWDQYFSGITTGTRTAHVEDLRPPQLKFLEAIGLSFHDPSISPHLNPAVYAGECRVPFGWRLGSFHYAALDAQDVRDFAFKAAADGASQVFTVVAEGMLDDLTVSKVKAFVEACRDVKRQLDRGATREDLGGQVSPAGQKKFWDHWR